jgi:mono/diheme cytochrome c family protein
MAAQRSFLAALFLAVVGLPSSSSFAADPNHGKALAKRFCTACHVVEREQMGAIDHAPPFASIATMPNFDENKLAFLLLRPHPNMPRLWLSRSEVADLAIYIGTLK